MRPLYLVACVAGKRSEACAARDLYTSMWFRKARAYVEARGGEWCVLSALHGVIAPERIIAPYDVTLALLPAQRRLSWGVMVLEQLALRAPAPRPLVLLAGARYRQPIEAAYGARVTVPMQGLGIGQQLAWLTHHREAAA